MPARKCTVILSILAAVTMLGVTYPARAAATVFSVSFPKSRSDKPLDGRILLILSTDASDEPRMQINDTPKYSDHLRRRRRRHATWAGSLVDASAAGYPIKSLQDVPPGEYYVQAVLHRYETFHRCDGHTVKLPMDRGEGQHWNIAPGNLYSTPRKVTVSGSSGPSRSCSTR